MCPSLLRCDVRSCDCIALHHAALHHTVLHRTTQFCTVLHCAVPHSTVPHCIASRSIMFSLHCHAGFVLPSPPTPGTFSASSRVMPLGGFIERDIPFSPTSPPTLFSRMPSRFKPDMNCFFASLFLFFSAFLSGFGDFIRDALSWPPKSTSFSPSGTYVKSY